MSSPVYVKYTVQNTDTLSALLNASTMTFAEWMEVNGDRNSFQSLEPGEKIILKDPGARCEDLYSLFKPLQAYTEHL